jgi:hypothetical protein
VAAALADFGAAGRRKLILVSDLLEHTAEASAYRGTFGVAVLAKVIPAEIAARFRGVEVQIVLLPRPGYIPQQKKAAGVWDEFLTSAMGHPPEWLRL